MSTTIDSKVVEMQFDNKHFETNVSTTMSTLDKLKEKLHLDGATKGLENVNSAANKINMSGLSSGIENVHSKFSALEVMGVTALANLANSAVNAGKRIVSALTIDPITTGFNEYELKMDSIKTIMASTGESVETVNKYLNELNEYSDQTIYSFADMTQNIGKFTNAGVKLEDAVLAIKGISNEAAVSGANANEASRAMYNFAQALSSGYVKLIDWKSIENANMATVEFKQQLLDTALALGTVVKEGDKYKTTTTDANGRTSEWFNSTMGFNDALSAQWMTTDVLVQTLGKYADKETEIGKKAFAAAQDVTKLTQVFDILKETAQSGWAKTWEIIVGDIEQAKALWTPITNTLSGIIDGMSDARNNLLSGALSTGWEQLLSAGIDDAAGFEEMVSTVAKEHGVKLDEMIDDEHTFRDTLKDGWLTGDMLSESVTRFTDKLSGMSNKELEAAGYTQETIDKMKALSEQVKTGQISMEEFSNLIARPSGRELLIESLWNAFNGLSSVIKPIKEAFRDIFPATTADQLYKIIQGLHEFISKLTLSDSASDKLKRTFKGLFAVLDIIKQLFVAVFNSIKPLFGGLDDLGGSILGVTASWGDWLVNLNESIKKNDSFSKAIERIKDILQKVGGFLKPVIEGIKEFGKSVSGTFSSIVDKAEIRFEPLVALGALIKGIFVGIANILKKILPSVSQIATGVGNALSSLMDRISSSIQDADYNTLFDIISGGIITSIGVFIAKFIKAGGDILDNTGGFLDKINGILDSVGESMNAFTESIKADTLKKIAIAIGILAASLFVISIIDSDKLATSLVAISTLFAELMGSMSIFSKISEGGNLNGLTRISGAIIKLSVGLLILAAALKIMSTMSWEEMGVGLTTMVVGLGALVLAVNLLPEKNVTKAAKAIQKLSTALLVFSVAMKILGSLSWEEMGVGLVAMTVGLGVMVGALHLLPKNVGLKAAGVTTLAFAMIILGAALKIMASMSWEEIAKGLVTLAGSLIIITGAMALMKKAIPGAIAMMIIAPALVILAAALKIMASMSWEEIAKGLITLAGSLLIIAAAMALMKTAIPGAAAILVVSAALVVLATVLKILGSMSWEEITRGLIALAGAFAVIGLAALILKPLIGTILGLSAAITLFGVACAAIGAGVLMIGVGLATLAGALAASGGAIVVFVSSIISLIPYIIEQIGVGIIKLCEVIAGSVDSICKAVTVIILAIVDALVASVPAIVDGVFILVQALLDSLVTYTPTIVAALFDFLIGVLNAVAAKLPELTQACVNVFMSFFEGVIASLKSIDPDILIQGAVAVGIMSALMVALAAVAALTPAAMVGVLGMAAVATELAVVLAAIGALAQIPGLEWLIGEGGNLLQKIGTAIGQFLGGIVGGFAQGATSVLPQIGTDLSNFMSNAKTFIDGAKSFDASTLDGVKALVGVILSLTAANLLDGITSWITGGSSLTKFGEEIAAFAPHIKAYADTVKGIDASSIEASANAAMTLSKLAENLPNSGGLAGWFAGENDIGSFGDQLVPFGNGMKAYSDAIAGFNADAVVSSANAAKALADMTSYIPNEGGVAAWFAGENSISKFGSDLVTLGKALFAYSISIVGFNAEAVIASANAAKALADMTSYIPNEGGMSAWFAGENSISKFGNDLILLGMGLKGFSLAIVGVNPDTLTAAANAAKALADMTSYIPNEGGMSAWFAGENSISKFSEDLVLLGTGLAGFSTAIAGVVPENISSAATAAKSLAEMASFIPNEGGVVSWFTGDNSISKFGEDLVSLGDGLLGFSVATTGIVPETISSAASAAKVLAEMTSYLPNEGGVTAWFGGEKSVSTFADNLPALGEGLKSFSDSVTGIVPENVTAAANAAKSLGEMVSFIPNEGGIAAWFSGEKSVSTFADNLPALGEGLKGFSDSVTGIVPENVTVAANAAKSLAEMANTAPKDSSKLSSFGEKLSSFGDKLKSYFEKVSGVSTESINASTKAINSITCAVNTLNPIELDKANTAISNTVKAVKDMSSVTEKSADGFVKAIKKLGETSVDALLKEFKDANPKLTNAGKDMIEKFIDGIEKKEKASKESLIRIINACVTDIRNKYQNFYDAGAYVVAGFAKGISAKTFKAEAAASAMAKAALKSAKEALDEHSPSREFYDVGDYAGLGFVNALYDKVRTAYRAGFDVADSAKNGLSNAISKVKDFISSDIDSQPTIRPVLDLSDVKTGVGAISGMLSGRRTLLVDTQSVGTISASMATRQNGVDSHELVSTIKGLRKDIANMPRNTYSINGITYDDGSNISEAVHTLVRAAKMERRT